MYTKTSVHKTDVGSESLFNFYHILILVEQVIGILLSQKVLDSATISIYHKFFNAIR